jgi:phenylacetate-CoA ligase
MEIRIEVTQGEPEGVAAAVAKEIRNGLNLRAHVKPIPHGTLPRFDLKARRFSDLRGTSAGVR